jgi:hypothetical protein
VCGNLINGINQKLLINERRHENDANKTQPFVLDVLSTVHWHGCEKWRENKSIYNINTREINYNLKALQYVTDLLERSMVDIRKQVTYSAQFN